MVYLLHVLAAQATILLWVYFKVWIHRDISERHDNIHVTVLVCPLTVILPCVPMYVPMSHINFCQHFIVL